MIVGVLHDQPGEQCPLEFANRKLADRSAEPTAEPDVSAAVRDPCAQFG